MTPEEVAAEIIDRTTQYLGGGGKVEADREELLRAVAAAILAEREACAQIADAYHRIDKVGEIGAEIRARGETK